MASKKELQKKSVLSGEVETKFPDEDKDHKNNKEMVVESREVEIINQFTGKKAVVKIDQEPGSDHTLAIVLADPNASREKKDAMISQYLFSRGMESASFLADIFAFKGHHTKETRAFKTQVRFDYELLVGILTQIFLDMGKNMARDVEEDPTQAIKGLAARFVEAAARMKSEVDKVTTERMREKGYGIYVSTAGQIYDIFDKDLTEAIEKDKKRLREKYEPQDINTPDTRPGK